MGRRFFASDNNASVHPEVLAAMAAANEGHAVAYGADPWTVAATARLRELFGEASEVYFVYNGTGANVLGMQSALASYHAVICTDCSHINVDECGAVENHTGAKLLPVPAPDGRLDPAKIAPLLAALGVEHHSQPRVISITQSTELGTVYQPEQIREIARICRDHELYLHMDGARLANAAVALGVGLAETSAALGVDILSLGGTKNGLMAGEAVVLFRPELARSFAFIRKQGMQLASKMRYIAAGFSALYGGDLWARSAAHANRMAGLLAAALRELDGVRIVAPVEANAVFLAVPKSAIAPARAESFFYVWDEPAGVVRLMCSHDTTEEDVQSIVDVIRRAVAGAPADEWPTAPASGSPFDLGPFLAGHAETPEVASEILRIYLDEAPLRLRAARDGLAAGNGAAVRAAAHSLANTCGTLHAPAAVARARELEVDARGDDPAATARALARLAPEVSRVLAAVEAHLTAGRG